MKTGRRKPLASGRKDSRTTISIGATQPESRSAAKSRSASPSPGPADLHWTFFTNHAHVLVLLSRNPSVVLREVAAQVGITERAVQRIIADLEASGIIDREKIGRQNHYRIRADRPLRHPIESHHTIKELLALLNSPGR